MKMTQNVHFFIFFSKNVILLYIIKIEIPANYMHIRKKNDFGNTPENGEFRYMNSFNLWGGRGISNET